VKPGCPDRENRGGTDRRGGKRPWRQRSESYNCGSASAPWTSAHLRSCKI